MTYCLRVLAVTLSITSSACAMDAPRKAAGRTVIVPIERTAGIQPDIENPEQCKGIGGWWTKVGPDSRESCIISPTDSGRACRDDSECQSSFCVAPVDAGTGEVVAGECSSGLVGRCKRLHVKQGKAIVDCIE